METIKLLCKFWSEWADYRKESWEKHGINIKPTFEGFMDYLTYQRYKDIK